MKTDSVSYDLFKTAPAIFFSLIGRSQQQGYRFDSVELKQTAFRIDGVFLPPPEAREQPVYFIEVQFQRDALLYHRLFGEIFLFLRQNPALSNWQAVVIYPNRSIEPDESDPFRELLASSRVRRIYLEELGTEAESSVALGLMQLIIEPQQTAAERAKCLLAQEPPVEIPAAVIMELVFTTLVYKFPEFSRQEIAAMLNIATDKKQTRVYQEGREDGLQEGKQEEGRSLVLRQLTRRIGPLAPEVRSQVEALSLEQLEALGEALLDFSSLQELTDWLQAQRNR